MSHGEEVGVAAAKGLGMRRVVLLMATAVLLATTLASPGAAERAGRCSETNRRNEYKFETFHVEYKFAKKLYAIGETVSVEVNVTRPAKKDPFGEGIPLPIERPFVEPVEGAIAGVGLQIGRVYLPGGSMTDADGNATVGIKLESYAPRNTWADAGIYVYKELVADPARCVVIIEYGYAPAPRVFRTT